MGNQPPAELYEPIAYTLSLGGKRIRPLLVIMAAEMFGGDMEEAIYPAIGIEVFHNFTLVHDDLMDNSPLRRNQPTVHRKWNKNIAILSADAMMVKAYELVCKTGSSHLREVLAVFNSTALQVCEGQQLDMNYETSLQVSIDQYIRMINLKTAVLLAGSLKIGALLAGANPEDAKCLYAFGENMGIAFQLQDDILDVYGEKEKFGKEPGRDIVANKKTYLLLKAIELAQAEVSEELTKWIAASQFDEQKKVKAIIEIYDSLCIRQLAEQEMMKYYRQGLGSLEKISIGPEKKQDLIAFVQTLMHRVY